MKKIEAIIFDMDGLLFDTEKIGFKVWRETCSKYGYNMDKKIFFSIISRNANEIREILTKEFGEKFDFDLCYKEKNQLANEEIDNIGVPIKKGAKELLDYLINSGGEVGLHGYTHQSDDQRSLNGTELSRKYNSSDKETREVIENAINTSVALNIPCSFFESPHYKATLNQKKIIEEYF